MTAPHEHPTSAQRLALQRAAGCSQCGGALDEIAYGDCAVCARLVCERCDHGYDPDTGHSVCPAHAAHPAAAGFQP